MSRLLIITFLSTLLIACGFKPVHSTTRFKDKPAFKSIKVEVEDPKRTSQKDVSYHLQQNLFDRLGQNSGPHILKLFPRVGRKSFGLSSRDFESRFDLNLRVRWQLIDSVDGSVLDKGVVKSTTTYGATRDVYGRVAARQNATEQVARGVADKLIIRLAAYYNETP